MGARPGFRRDIEGLRGVAVLAVVAFHAGLPAFGGGFVGVDVFFVISGFLITGILVGQAESGRVHLLDFWARRIRRLVPALTVVVVATLLASLVVYSPLAWAALAREAAASSLYVSNVLFARDATAYFALPLGDSPYLHTWSLGVEEQFYLAWPILFFAVARLGGRRRGHSAVSRDAVIAAMLVAVALVSFALSSWLTHRSQPWAFFSSPTRAWEFALGGLVAVASSRASIPSRAATPAGWLGLAAIALAVVRYDDFTLYPGTAALLPVAGAAALVAVGGQVGRLGAGRLLAWTPLTWLGGVSYTWYLWHWPLIVLTAASFPDSGVVARTGMALVALVLAWATTRFVEAPIRFRSAFTGSRRWTYAGGLAATVLAVALCLGVGQLAQQRRDADPVLADLAAARSDKTGMTPAECGVEVATVAPCASGDLDADRTILLIGDSHAAHWRPAVDAVAERLGARVVMSSFGGCPAVDLPAAREGTHQLRRTCAADRAYTAALIDRIQPDAVLVSQSDYLGLILDDDGDVLPLEQQRDRWNAALRDLAEDLAARDVALGLVLDVPLLDRDPIECLAKGGDADRCGADAEELAALATRAEGERAALRDAGHGTVFDPIPLLCPDGTCPLQQDGVYVYADPEHLTRAFARRLAPELQPFVAALLSPSA